MKLAQLESNVFEDTETKTKFVLLGFQGTVRKQDALDHIENFKRKRIEVLLAKHFDGRKHEILCGQLPK